jgi:hypothetical protein
MGGYARVAFLLLGAMGTQAQDGALQTNASDQTQHREASPVYQVTVVSRTTKAINYGTRSEPTKVDFKGTVLMSDARGEATVQSRQGVVQIKARFEHVAPPTGFGSGYLTYALWAISPDGRAQNLGELVLDAANKGKLDVSTNLQAFALIVTAEPYFAVTQPSDVVVMENAVRPDTSGAVEEVDAKYELLPRTPFLYEIHAQKDVLEGRKLSKDEYEATLALYEAQNAIQLAKAAGAERYASDIFQRSEQLYQQALDAKAHKAGIKDVVTPAREAAQRGADARTVSLRKQQIQGTESSVSESTLKGH